MLLTHRVADWQGYIEKIIFYTKDQNENDNKNNNEKEGNNRCPICSSFLQQVRQAKMYTEGIKPPTLHWQACDSRDDQQSARLSLSHHHQCWADFSFVMFLLPSYFRFILSFLSSLMFFNLNAATISSDRAINIAPLENSLTFLENDTTPCENDSNHLENSTTISENDLSSESRGFIIGWLQALGRLLPRGINTRAPKPVHPPPFFWN